MRAASVSLRCRRSRPFSSGAARLLRPPHRELERRAILAAAGASADHCRASMVSRHRSARSMLGGQGVADAANSLRSWGMAAKPPGGPNTTAQSFGREVTTSRDPRCGPPSPPPAARDRRHRSLVRVLWRPRRRRGDNPGCSQGPGSTLAMGSEAPLRFPSSPPPWRASAPGWARRARQQLVGRVPLPRSSSEGSAASISSRPYGAPSGEKLLDKRRERMRGTALNLAGDIRPAQIICIRQASDVRK
jgi:hypothetical protein